jgi:hypothetical protein
MLTPAFNLSVGQLGFENDLLTGDQSTQPVNVAQEYGCDAAIVK